MCLEPLQKDANNVAERFIEASAGFIQEFMDVHSPT
jgi:hypothetical protein